VEHATSSRIPHKTSTSVTQNIQQSNDNSTASEDAKLSFRLSPLERAQATVQAVIKNAPKTGISATNRGAVQRIDDDIEFSDTLIAETELLTSAIKSLLADLEPASHSTNTVSNAVFHADVVSCLIKINNSWQIRLLD
jgi:hypothetical protein